MNDELDPEVFGDLPDPEEFSEDTGDAEVPESEEAPAGLYPFVRGLGGSEQHSTFLCRDPFREGGELVQKLFREETTRERIDWVEVGMVHLQDAAHPNLAMVRDFGYEGAQAFLIRDFVQGQPLLQALASASMPQILQAFHQILGALDYLYQQGLHHLRLHPGNLFWSVEANGQALVKITDFGMGAWLDRKSPGQSQTVGIPPYTAPEYAMNPYPDTRADLYSFGILLFQALTKKFPFAGTDPVQLMQQQLSQDPPPLSKLIQASKTLADFVAALTHRDPTSRYRDPREALVAMSKILRESALPVAAPAVFSGPEEAFFFKRFAKLFRRIVLQGRRWAFRGPRGAGKTYFARWIQRYFWINHRDVRFYRGADLIDAKGENILHPTEPLFILVDDADGEEVGAWLETRPYQHVVLFGESLNWAKADSRWQFFDLEVLSQEAAGQVYEELWTPLPETQLQTLYRGHQGLAGAMVEQGRSLQRLQQLEWDTDHYHLQGKNFSNLANLQAKGFSPSLATLPRRYDSIYTLLALSGVPLSSSNLEKICGEAGKDMYPDLIRRCEEGLLRRSLWLGQEYFAWDATVPKRLENPVAEASLVQWMEGLVELDWYEGALRVMQSALDAKQIRQDSRWQINWVAWAAEAGRFGEVLTRVTAPWVDTLPDSGKGVAFEALGKALWANHKEEQAVNAFKNAFTQYRSQQDLAGQTQTLTLLGALYLEQGDHSHSLKFLEQALTFAEKQKESHPHLLGRVQYRIGQLYEAATDHPQAETYYHQSVETLFPLGRYPDLAAAYQGLAGLYLKMGDSDQAESYAREAVVLARFKNAHQTTGQALLILAEVEERRGNLVWVQERLQQGVAALKRAKRVLPYGRALIRRAYFFENNRQLDRARNDAQEVKKLGEKIKDPALIGQAHLVLGKVLRRDLEKLDAARSEFEAARKIFAKTQQVKFAWECEFEEGEIERNRGNASDARTHYEAALKMIDEYVASVTPQVHEAFLKDGKRERIEMAIKWLD